ncbi:hypothetical protein BZA70DRAFT_289261 [Myxozyma melibiosi]|uniref:F-box domain-containing protein n=1 Tax=Myxozyma melibiosi TaxID=54550 RepID=A0ABR1F6B2_9ASCO
MVDNKYFDFEALPDEILLLIISYLPCKTLISMCSLSHFWRQLICNSQTFRREFEFIKDGAITEDSVIAYVAKNVPEIVRINASNPLFWQILEEESPVPEDSMVEPDPEMYFSLPRFLTRCRAIRNDDISRNRFVDLCDMVEQADPSDKLDYDPISPTIPLDSFTWRYWSSSPLIDDLLDYATFAEICTHIHLRLNTWDTAVWECESNSDQSDSGIVWEILRGVQMLSIPLDAMMTYFCAAAENSQVHLGIKYLRFLVQPGSSVTIESQQLRWGQQFENLHDLIINDDVHGDFYSPRPRHEISQDLLAQILLAMPNLGKLVLCDFHVLSDDEKQECLDMRQRKCILHVDFSGTEFACGFPLLSDKCYYIMLRRSPHIADLLGAGTKCVSIFQHSTFIDLSGNSEITDAMLINNWIFAEVLERGYWRGRIALRNCPGLRFSSQLHEHLMHYHTIDLSRNEAVTDDVLSGLLQIADAAPDRLESPWFVDVSRTSVTEQAYKRFMKQYKHVHVDWCRSEEIGESFKEKNREKMISDSMT